MTHKAMKWIIHAQTTFPPAPPLSHNNEGLIQNYSKENFSLSHSSGYYVKEERLSGCKMPTESETEELKGVANERLINNNNNTERERNFTPKIFGKIENTTDDELAVLDAVKKKAGSNR